MSDINKFTRIERNIEVMRKKNIMLKLTDILMQEQLITPDEKIRLTTLIAKEDEQ